MRYHPRRLRIETLEDRTAPAVTTSFDSVAGRLIVRSDGADPLVVTAAGPAAAPVVGVNGQRLAVAASAVKTLDVRGGPGNNRINLAGVTPRAFSALTRVQADGGAGRDTMVGSPFADDFLGGPDDDVLRGGSGNDTLRGGGGLDVLEGGAGDDLLTSSDPVDAGFNDTWGLTADATPDSPYQIGGPLVGRGQGEPGWAAGWQQPLGAASNAVVQSDVRFEGDGGLKVSGGTTAIYRDWSAAEPTGVVTVSQMVYIPAGGGLLQYVQDGTGANAETATAAQWMAPASGNFQVVDSGVVEDTGIPVPIQRWVRVDVRVDMTARTWEFFVDGVKYNAPDPLGFRGTPGALNRVVFLLENVPGFYLDALQVDGPDAPTPGARGDTLRGGFGADTLRGSSGAELLVGGAGNDSATAGTGNDTVYGGPGADDLAGNGGDDEVWGQGGNDTLEGGEGSDRLNGGFGLDELWGQRGPDKMSGGPGMDSLFGATGADSLAGGGGLDQLYGGGGADRLDGGPGDDILDSDDPDAPIEVQAGFNDAEGFNADATPDSPYRLGSPVAGQGAGEPGWAGPWEQSTAAAGLATVQAETVFEGDGALGVSGGTAEVQRAWADAAATGVVSASVRVYLPAGGHVIQYVRDGAIEKTAGTAAQWAATAGGTFAVIDGGAVEDTGIPVPVGEWVQVAVRVDMDARTWEFWVNSTRYVAPDPLDFRGNPGAVSMVTYLVESMPGVILDAVQVVGPDPGGSPEAMGDTLVGGLGHDWLEGGRGHDLLLGGAGIDTLNGGDGRDVLIGGTGSDDLTGVGGQDILIGGTTAYDSRPGALPAILAEWTSARDFTTRVANIRGTGTGPRLNGDFLLRPRTVFPDGAPDTLTGADDFDWFFLRPGEDTTDAAAGDLTTEL